MSDYKIKKIFTNNNTNEIVEWDLTQTPHNTLSGTGIKSHDDIDSHIDTSNIHFPWQDVVTVSGALKSQLDDHTGDATIHFLESEISHLNIQDVGSTTHSGIDAHIATSGIHFTWEDPI